jgi:hypothetical protein
MKRSIVQNMRLTVLAIGAIVVPMLATPSIADARSVGGFAARAVNPSYAQYLTENWATVIIAAGAPAGGITVEIPDMLVDTATNYNPTIGVKSPNAGDVACASLGQSSINNGGVYSWTGYIQPGTIGAATTFQPGTVTVPTGGFLTVACAMKPGSTLYNLYW